MLPEKQDTFLPNTPITYRCKDAVITSAFVDCLHLAALDLSTSSKSAAFESKTTTSSVQTSFPLSKPFPVTTAAPVSSASQQPASIVSPNAIQSQPTKIGNGSFAHQKALNPMIATVPVQKKPPALFNTTTTTPMQKVFNDKCK